MDNPFKSPIVLSFCPGILGIERGLARADVNCRVAAYVEIEAFIIANLVEGMEAGILDPAPIWTDAKTFDARPFRGRIHGIIGGYPCPGESLAGLREGHLYKGWLWPAIRRAIATARPLWCFFENVDDHLTGTYPIVQRSLRNMGYRVEEGIYTAEEVGCPQERKRLFILAMANTHSLDAVRVIRDILQENRENESQAQKWERDRNEFNDSGETLAEPLCNPGIEIQTKERQSSQRSKFISNGQTGRNDRFPKPQGFEQWEWEEPRVVPQSEMGSTIDGYNFRRDLFHALGNSVVEQTAELAFIDLLNKHLKNL